MKKVWFFLLPLFFLFAEEKNTQQVSEAFGHLIRKNLEELGLELDLQALMKGIADEASGKRSPMSEQECMDALAALQEKSFEKMAQKNLDEANNFLSQNKKKKGVVSLEKGKVQYEVLKKGEGAALQDFHCPMVRLEEKFLNQTLHGTLEEILFLDDVMEGLKEGLLGMKEGEKRTIYIHPEHGYGKQNHLAPNALLIVDVEILKLDASSDAHAASEREIDSLLPLKSPEEKQSKPQ